MNMKKERWNIKNAVRKSKNKINFNPAYQREYEAPDKAGWQPKLIKSIFLKRDLPKIYIRVQNIGDENKPRPSGHLYECVDGQQRLKTFVDFQNNLFSLPKKCDITFEGTPYELGEKTYEEILDINSNIIDDLWEGHDLDITYCEGSDSEMSDMFYDLNDLNSMNPQQKRNCIISDVAVFVRDTARNPENKEDVKHSLFGIDDEVKRDGTYLGFKSKKMAFDHLLAEMCCYETYGITRGLSNKELETMYRDLIMKKEFPYRESVNDNLNHIYGILKNQDYTKAANKNVVTNLYMVVNYFVNTYSNVKFNYDKFSDWFFTTHGNLKTLTKQMKIDKLYETPYSADTRVGKDKDAVSRRLNYFIEKLNIVELSDIGIITRDSNRVLNDTDTLVLYIESKKKCQACDKSLKLGEVCKGHKTAWSKGGKSIKNNTVILCQSCNSKQGDMDFDEFVKLEAFV